MSSRFNKISRTTIALGLIASLALLVGCAQGVSTAPAETPAETGPMSVKILEPVAGAEVPSGTVKVAVETSGIKFVMPSNTLVAGEGHVHFTLDDRPFVMSTEKETELEDVEPGMHTLKAELVQNDTQPFDPPIEEVVEFTAK